MTSKYRVFDRNRLHLRPLGERNHDMDVGDLLHVDDGEPEFDHPHLPVVAGKVRQACDNGAARLLMMGTTICQ